jgi:hypothetical protein
MTVLLQEHAQAVRLEAGELDNVPAIGLVPALPARATACDGRGPAGPAAVSFGLFSESQARCKKWRMRCNTRQREMPRRRQVLGS